MVFAALLPAALMVLPTLIAFHFFRRYQNTANKLGNSQELINNLEEGVYRSSLEGKQLSANPSLVKLNGYESEAEQLEGVENIALEWYVDPNRRDEFKSLMLENGRVSNFVSEIYRHKTRERIWISENARVVYHPKTKEPLYFEGTVRDITDKVKRKQTEKLLNRLTKKLPTGLFQLVRTPDGNFSCPYVSQRFREIGNISENEEFKAKEFYDRIHPDDRRKYDQELKHSGKTLAELRAEFRFLDDDLGYQWCSLLATPEPRDDGGVVWHGHMTNINEQKTAAERVKNLAYFDPLTELPNRINYIDQINEHLEDSSTYGSYSAVCFIDLDNFKVLNDSHGHSFGDQLLRMAARQFREILGDDVLVSRFGGDEFVLLLKDLGKGEDEAKAVANQIVSSLLEEARKGFVINGKDCPITLSVGIAMFEVGPGLNTDDLLKSADIAMYEAKKQGRDSAVFYDNQAFKNVTEGYDLQQDLQVAIRKNQFQLELQPQVDKYGKVKSAEVLTRWHHPVRGKILPQDFISLAEQSGQICQLNEWVFQESFELLKKWSREPALAEVSVSVNFSPRQMLDTEFISRMVQTLSEYPDIAKRVVIELTEHVMARNPETVAQSMQRLKELGVRFSLDDFGTGYSSISQLRKFPFDELKIDGSFVTDMCEEQDVQTMVTAIIDMANALGIHTVAEHVSEIPQFELLKFLGCNHYQGYLFCRSLSIHDFETFMKLQNPLSGLMAGRAKAAG